MNSAKNLIGAYLVIGCLTGLYGVINYSAATWQYPSVLWIGLCFGAIYSAIGASGYYLIRTGRYFWWTILLQAIQSVGFCALGIKYIFCAGASFKAGYRPPNLYYVIEPINVEFSFGVTSDNYFFYINFIPILVIFLLSKYCISSTGNIVG